MACISKPYWRQTPSEGWDRPTTQAWAERLDGDPRLDWLEQPLAVADPQGLERLAALVPVALDESLRADPALAQR